MSLYRCAVCGSEHVITDKQKSGVKYDYVKGAVGAAIVGLPGTLAGFTSDSRTVYVCKDCGATLTYPMPEELKNLIDIGCMTGRKNNLVLHGARMDWDVLKSQYKNIAPSSSNESGKHSSGSPASLKAGTATREELNKALEFYWEYCIANGDTTKPNDTAFPWPSPENPFSLQEYLAIMSAIDVIVKNVPKYYSAKEIHDGIVLPEGKIYSFMSELFRGYMFTSDYKRNGKARLWYDPDEWKSFGPLTDYFDTHPYEHDYIMTYVQNYSGPIGQEPEEMQRNIALRGFVNNCGSFGDTPFMHIGFSVHMDKDTLLYKEGDYPSKYSDGSSFREYYTFFAPKYRIINGQLCAADWTYDHAWRQITEYEYKPGHFKVDKSFYGVKTEDDNYCYQTVLNYYFTAHPEKVEEYNRTINEFFAPIEARTNELSTAKSRLSKLKNEEKRLKGERSKKVSAEEQIISQYAQEIQKLKGKIFGRAKAKEQIAVLEEQKSSAERALMDYRDTCNEKLAALKKEMKTLSQKISQLDATDEEKKECFKFAELITALINKYDFFGVWTPVDESLCKNTLLDYSCDETAPSDNGQATNTVAQISSADEILKFKNLLDLGVITEEEYSQKKKQLLGL